MYSIQIQRHFIKTNPQDVPHFKSQTTVQSLFTEFVFWNTTKWQSKIRKLWGKLTAIVKTVHLSTLNSQAAQKKETKHKYSQAVPNHLTWILFYIFYSELRLYRSLLSYCKKDMCNNWGKVILAQNWFNDK